MGFSKKLKYGLVLLKKEVLIALGELTPHDGKSLRASSTTPPGNSERGPRLIAVPNGKKDEYITMGNPHPSFYYITLG